MNKSISTIAWPAHPHDAVQLFVHYMLRVIEQLGISFNSSSDSPVSIAEGLLAERLSKGDRLRALAYWWDVVDKRGIQNFEDKNALLARLAICLLSPDEADVSNFGEQLSWFLEVLGFFGADVDKAIDIMEAHFDFNQGRSSPDTTCQTIGARFDLVTYGSAERLRSWRATSLVRVGGSRWRNRATSARVATCCLTV